MTCPGRALAPLRANQTSLLRNDGSMDGPMIWIVVSAAMTASLRKSHNPRARLDPISNERDHMRLFSPRLVAYAHCDLPCGIYDPAQARLEAESVKACMQKYHGSDDPDFKARAVAIKETRSTMVKEHLWVLWTDYFKAPHFEKYPQLNDLFNQATKLAGAGGTKGTVDVAVADQLLAKIDEIAAIFWETKAA